MSGPEIFFWCLSVLFSCQRNWILKWNFDFWSEILYAYFGSHMCSSQNQFFWNNVKIDKDIQLGEELFFSFKAVTFSICTSSLSVQWIFVFHSVSNQPKLFQTRTWEIYSYWLTYSEITSSYFSQTAWTEMLCAMTKVIWYSFYKAASNHPSPYWYSTFLLQICWNRGCFT